MRFFTGLGSSMLEAVESFYLETLEGWYFAVKGMEHPPDRTIAVLRYAPDPHEGERTKGGKRYRRLYGFAEQERWIRRFSPLYMAFDPVFQTALQSVPLSRVRKVYSPSHWAQTLADSDRFDPLVEDAGELLRVIRKEAGVPMSALGLTGSLLIGMHSENSDIDISVFGGAYCRKVYAALRGVLQGGGEKDFCRLDEREMKGLYSQRSVDTVMPFADFHVLEKRKANQGRFRNRTWFARFVRTRDEAECTYGERVYLPLGRGTIHATVTEDGEAIFTPCRYAIAEVRDAEDSALPLPEEIVSFRGRFCDQAVVGERVAASGLLEEVRGTEGRVRYRLLLGNYPGDTMVLLR